MVAQVKSSALNQVTGTTLNEGGDRISAQVLAISKRVLTPPLGPIATSSVERKIEFVKRARRKQLYGIGYRKARETEIVGRLESFLE